MACVRMPSEVDRSVPEIDPDVAGNPRSAKGEKEGGKQEEVEPLGEENAAGWSHLTPSCANLYLHWFDKEGSGSDPVAQRNGREDRLVRYADDFVACSALSTGKRLYGWIETKFSRSG